MRSTWLAMAVAIAVFPLSAQAMTVNQFLGKIDGLKAKGIGALFSPDIGLLKSEMRGVVADYQADVKLARVEGRTPPGCPPEKDNSGAKFGKDEFIDELRALPPARRGMSVKSAFYAMMRKRYPCA